MIVFIFIEETPLPLANLILLNSFYLFDCRDLIEFKLHDSKHYVEFNKARVSKVNFGSFRLKKSPLR